MKKTMRVLVIAALILILLTGGILWYVFSLLPSGKPASGGDVEQYLAEHWTIFRVRSWDPSGAALELDYDLPFTLEQVRKYAGSVEELAQTPSGNLQTVKDLCDTVEQELGVTIQSVTVRGLTADGETAYTVGTDGTFEVCWETQPAG